MKSINSKPRPGRPKMDAQKRKSITVPVKYDLDKYEVMMNKALAAGLNRSEYIREASVRCKVMERLTPRDVKIIRDLQGIAQNLNTIAKFANALIKAGLNDDRTVSTYKSMLEHVEFIKKLIRVYRNTPETP